MALALTDLARAKEFVKITGVANDPFLNSLITALSGTIERFFNRYTESKLRTKVVDAYAEENTYKLRGFPITSVTSVKFDRQQDFASAVALDADRFVIPDDRGYIETRFPLIPRWGQDAPQSVQIIYTGGIATNLTALRASDEFAAIEDFMLVMLQRRYKRKRTSADQGALSGQKGGYTYGSQALSTEEKMMLESWRRRNG